MKYDFAILKGALRANYKHLQAEHRHPRPIQSTTCKCSKPFAIFKSNQRGEEEEIWQAIKMQTKPLLCLYNILELEINHKRRVLAGIHVSDRLGGFFLVESSQTYTKVDVNVFDKACMQYMQLVYYTKDGIVFHPKKWENCENCMQRKLRDFVHSMWEAKLGAVKVYW